MLKDDIEGMLGKDWVITPDQVQSNYANLREAVLENGWPTLKDSLGKFMFILMGDEDELQDWKVLDKNNEIVKGSPMFVTNDETEKPYPSVIKIDSPFGNEERIKDLVKKGFLI